MLLLCGALSWFTKTNNIKSYITLNYSDLWGANLKKRQSVFSKVMVIKLPRRRQCRFTDPKSLSTEHFSATTHRYTAVLKHFLVIFANHVDKTHQRQTCLRIRWSCVSFRPSVRAKQFHFAKASKQCSCNYELKKKIKEKKYSCHDTSQGRPMNKGCASETGYIIHWQKSERSLFAATSTWSKFLATHGVRLQKKKRQ